MTELRDVADKASRIGLAQLDLQFEVPRLSEVQVPLLQLLYVGCEFRHERYDGEASGSRMSLIGKKP
jgi:hypothetical protein